VPFPEVIVRSHRRPAPDNPLLGVGGWSLTFNSAG
jgi:hypothetical protein